MILVQKNYITLQLCYVPIRYLFLTCTVVRCGRSFVSRIYTTAAKLQELEYFTHLSKDFRTDLSWWHTFLAEWNGISLLCYSSPSTKNDCCIQTDASGSWGCSAFFEGE